MTHLIQELDIQDDEEENDEASDFNDMEEEDIMTTKNKEADKNPETTVQDF